MRNLKTSGMCGPCYHVEYRKDPVNKRRNLERSQAWNAANPDRRRQSSLDWQRANPDRVKEIRHKTMTGLKNRFTRAKWIANKRGLSWDISIDELADLREMPCTYCKAELDAYGAGLDRIDNSKGYQPGNVVPCCGTCNRTRADRLTHEEMLVAMAAVLKLRNRKRMTLVPSEKA